MNKILPKTARGTIYVVGVIGLLVAFFLDGGDAGTAASWIDQASEAAAAVGSILALVNLRDPAKSAEAEPSAE
jgi:hypothetical protein